MTCFTREYNKTLATKNYARLQNKEEVDKTRVLKAVNAVIAVLTSTW
ncbi:hypothetical protein J5893_04740 [bacterium]|nr:hypothetical protein [bacterium]